jgi:hypothetical protein
MQRRDVSGQIMKEKPFYDPFIIYNQPFVHRMCDMDTTKNTFLFRFYQNRSDMNRRLYYALRWENEHSKDSPWSILHFDETGKATNLLSGAGYQAYETMLDSLAIRGIKREEIMFGGIPDQKDSLRLGLK